MNDIKISVSEGGSGDAISIVRVDGVIDTLTATQLEDVLERLLKRNRFNLILDLAGVDYISSAGWGIFISRIKEIRERNGDIKLANMVPNVMEVYELLEFDSILSAHGNIGGARSAFNSGQGNQSAKKKVRQKKTLTTIAELPLASGNIQAESSTERTPVQRSKNIEPKIDNVILGAIEEDPFYTISEIKVVIEESLPGTKSSWWKVFRFLWTQKLLSRRARFRYARQSRKGR